MSTTRHDQLSRLFVEAMEQPPGIRGPFVDERCAHDRGLAVEVREMIAASEASCPGLQTGALALAGDVDDGWVPETVGPYRLVEYLGTGGMGVVYRAEQEEPLCRQVALKLIRPGFETAEIIRRFESERQALATMDHPGVARVIDAGVTAEGRPYFAMEFVEGTPLTHYCDERRLSIRRRLELFRAVCEGIQHAHQNAIIHRDIKPSNILVTEKHGVPVPKIIDFGVAKAIGGAHSGETLHTQVGQLIGTPQYMSPEQADPVGRAPDTRTDVYALGVVLYELLTGTLPFVPGEERTPYYDELRRRICETDAVPPSKALSAAESVEPANRRDESVAGLRRRLRGDLDWIVLRALEKEPDRRYASARELADELGRHLRSEPVQAGPRSIRYRVAKFVQKHRFGVAVTVATILVAGAVGYQGNRMSRRAAAASRNAEAITQFLSRSIDRGDTFNVRGYATDVTGLFGTMAVTVDELDAQPLQRGELVYALAGIQMAIDRPDVAERLLEQVRIDLIEAGHGQHRLVLAARSELAFVDSEFERYASAVESYRQVLADQRRVLGDSHEDTLVTATRLAFLLDNNGAGEARAGEALELLERTCPDVERRYGAGHANVWICRGMLGASYSKVGRPEEALSFLRGSLDPLAAAVGKEHFEYAVVAINLALVESEAGNHERALALLEVASRSIWVDPREYSQFAPLLEMPRFKAIASRMRLQSPEARTTQRNAYRQLEKRGQLDAAAELAEELLIVTRAIEGRDAPGAVDLADELARILLASGRFTEAETLLIDQVERRERVNGKTDLKLPTSWWMLAQAQFAQHRADEARASLLQAEAIDAIAGGPSSQDHFYYRAAERTLAGDGSAAVTLLRRIKDFPGYYDIVVADPLFADLHGDAAFERFLAGLQGNPASGAPGR